MNINTPEIVQKIKETDVDGNGQIDYDEFLHLIECLRDT